MSSEENPSILPEGVILLKKITQGNESAFRKLFDMYYQRLFHLAFFFLKSKELSEEAVSDVFFTIWKKRETLDTIQDIEKYLYIAVKNQALHYIRRSALPDNEPIDLYGIELIPDNDNPELALLDKEYRDLIQQAINSLPYKCREVFRLVQSDKLKQKEIAEVLDISIKTVEAHISTAYKRIAEYVNKEYKSTSKSNKLLSIIF